MKFSVDKTVAQFNKNPTWFLVPALALVLLALGWQSWLYPFFYDDAFISMRIAKNFITGNGLYHNTISQVQTNTSVLAPLLYSPLQLAPPYLAFKLVMVVDLLLLALSAWLVAKTVLGQIKINAHSKSVFTLLPIVFSMVMVAALVGADVVCFGMETQLYIFYATVLFYLYGSGRQAVALMLSGGLIFIRPEGVLVSFALFVCWLPAFVKHQPKPQFGKLVLYLAIMATGWVAYFVFCRLYYHSWLPHTLLVKANMAASTSSSFAYLYKVVFEPTLRNVLTIYLLVPMAIWFLKTKRPAIVFNPIVIWLLLYSVVFGLKGAFIPGFRWYVSPIIFALTTLVFAGFAHAWPLIKTTNFKKWYLVAMLFTTIIMANRAVDFIGKQQLKSKIHFNYLKMTEDFNCLTGNLVSTVHLEPLGYAGFFNMDKTFFDYPGLASKQVVDIIDQSGVTLDPSPNNFFNNSVRYAVINQLQTDMVLLRKPYFKNPNGLPIAPLYTLLGIAGTGNNNETMYVYMRNTLPVATKIALRKRAKHCLKPAGNSH